MKAKATKDNLARGISIVSRAVSTRSTLPALSSILIASDGQRLRLQATDLTKAITCWIDARVDEPGALAVPAKTFADTVAAIAAGEEIDLSVDTKTGTLLLKAGRSKTEVKGISAEDFPIIPAGDQADIWSESIEMVKADLLAVIGRTTFCAATDEARPVLTGVLMQLKKDSAVLAATDGFRLAVANAPLQNNGPDIRALVQAAALDDVARALSAGEADTVAIRLAKSGNQIVFTAASVEVIAQLLEGQYPNYEEIIPKAPLVTVEMAAAELRTALKGVDVFARENDHTVRLTFGANSLTIRGQSAETGWCEAKVAARMTGAEAFEITFNAKLALGLVGAINPAPGGVNSACVFRMSEAHRPALITPAEGNGYLAVLMPMRVEQKTKKETQDE